MTFWANSFDNAEIRDPKRKFRWIIKFDGIAGKNAGVLWYAKSCAKPSFKIGEAEHKYLNHTFYYPGGTTWDTIDVVMVDPVDPNAGYTLAAIVEAAGYDPPNNALGQANLATMSKGKAVHALGNVEITQLGADGLAIEQWTLWNAWISALKFGDLEYGSDELIDLTVTLRYDWARMSKGLGGNSEATHGLKSANSTGHIFALNGGSEDAS